MSFFEGGGYEFAEKQDICCPHRTVGRFHLDYLWLKIAAGKKLKRPLTEREREGKRKWKKRAWPMLHFGRVSINEEDVSAEVKLTAVGG